MKSKKIVIEILVSDGPDYVPGHLEAVSNDIVAGVANSVNGIISRSNPGGGLMSNRKVSIIADVAINVLRTEEKV